jgi:YceI-like domain
MGALAPSIHELTAARWVDTSETIVRRRSSGSGARSTKPARSASVMIPLTVASVRPSALAIRPTLIGPRSRSRVVGDQGAIAGELVVDATSIDTKNKRRDKHLRGADFFDVSKYPTFSFSASEVVPSGDGTLRIKGALHIKDQSQTIELVATPSYSSPDRVTVNGEATIDRSSWGMTWKMGGAWLVNRVVIGAQFVRS